jgi:transposase
VKKLFSLGGISTLQYNGELRINDNKKLAEVKDKILAINNIRNKLIGEHLQQ